MTVAEILKNYHIHFFLWSSKVLIFTDPTPVFFLLTLKGTLCIFIFTAAFSKNRSSTELQMSNKKRNAEEILS